MEVSMVIPHPNPGRVNCSSEVKPGVVTGQALVDLLNYAKVEGLGFWKEKQNQ